MVCVNERTQSMQLRGFSRILSTIRQGFFEDSNSITELQKKNKKFVWTEKCVESFQRLKELLTTTPILKSPNMDEEFLVCNDASKEGLGIILMQDNRMITYTSRKLRTHDEKYTMHDSELLAIVYALRAWRHYLIR
jgi:hypothetical protein